MKRKKVLIVDDEQSLLESLEMFFSDSGYDVACASTAQEGFDRASRFCPDVIVLDIRLPDKDGFQVLEELRRRKDATPVIMITAFHDMETTIKTVKLKAFEYIPKPIDVDELERAVRKALKFSHSSPVKETIPLDVSFRYDQQMIVGKSGAMKEIFQSVGKVSENRVTVLIEGETGTGKELIAKAIHRHSRYKDEPFVAINCSTIVPTLLESELFGHEKGAFTGAIKTRFGRFELADGGTVFLDEIGELPVPMQPKLLRVLEEKEFERVGGTRVIRSNFRLIAATNQSLDNMIRDGRFRKDLFYRLNVFPITIPPIRERREDIIPVFMNLLQKLSAEADMFDIRLDQSAQKILMAHAWPGNVRELSNVLEWTLSSLEGNCIRDKDLPFYLKPRQDMLPPEKHSPMREVHAHAEVQAIRQTLKEADYNKARAARILGIHRTLLYKKIKKYGLET